MSFTARGSTTHDIIPMDLLQIQIADGRTTFRPGDKISGGVGWTLDQPAKSIEMRLFWYTRGKGTTDVQVVDRKRFDDPAKQDRKDFTLNLPVTPYSFSGTLISLVWALELIAEPGGRVERLELVVAPEGQEIHLYPLPK